MAARDDDFFLFEFFLLFAPLAYICSRLPRFVYRFNRVQRYMGKEKARFRAYLTIDLDCFNFAIFAV